MIFWFSGCGNTAIVASRLANQLGEPMQRIDINAPLAYDVTAHQRIIWAFPVYSWGMPPAVKTFIREVRLTGADSVPHYMVATCGDDAGYTDLKWAREISRRGWKASAAHTVIMPNTYVSLPGFDIDPQELADRKLADAPEKIKSIAHAIKCKSNITDVVRGKFAWAKSYILYPLFIRFLMSPKPFQANKSCTGCGTCSRSCPMGNIQIINDNPQWGNRCTMCLSCYHRCPIHAVEYGRQTREKGQYKAPSRLSEKE